MRLTFSDRFTHASRANSRVPLRLVIRELSGLVTAGLRERIPSSTRAPHMVHTQDIRYAFRLLSRSPGFSLLTGAVLAGGLGLSTFTFSFLHTAMIRPLPLGEGERIVRIDGHIKGGVTPPPALTVLTER